MPEITPKVYATGGVVALSIILSSGVNPFTGQISLNRYTGSLTNTPQLIYQGNYTPLFIDDGELLQQYLDFSTTYYWSVTDTGGTATTPAIVPAPSVVVTPQYLDKLIFRLFSAGVSALALQASGLGFGPINVKEAMPLTFGNEILPIIVMNLDLEQQENIGIGAILDASPTNVQIIDAVIFRRYSINVLSQNAAQRNFYKDALAAAFYPVMQAMQDIGNSIEFSWQVAQSQVGTTLNSPGFYEAQFMIDMTGQFKVQINTSYGLIKSIVPDVSGLYPNGDTIIN